MNYNGVYDYSRKYISLSGKLTRLIIKIGVNTFFGILIYLFVAPLPLLIAAAIIISFLVDWTWERKEIRDLKKQQKIYASTFIKLSDELKKAQKDIKARDEFLSIVSHELRTPLTVMLLKLHKELNDIKSASLANFSVHELMAVLKNSEQQIKWLKSMINDLLDVSLITTGRMDLHLEDTDLVSIAQQVKQSFSEAFRKEKSKIKISAESPVVGKWDKVRLEQVVTNLFSNAIKYGAGKPIDIQILKQGGNAKFIIRDQGIGIPSHEQKAIFDLFKRAPGPGEYKKGLGVGLYISSQIVKMHQGKIKVSSSPNKGTTFTIELPLK